MNPTEAPRASHCFVCRGVASPVDVTMRLFDAELNDLPVEGAVKYLRLVGYEGTARSLAARALMHRRHVRKWLDQGGQVAPAGVDQGISRIEPLGDVGWVDHNQKVINVGDRALDLIAAELGSYEATEKIAVARMGSAAANSRANLEMKGAIRRQEEMDRLAAGVE